MIFSKINYETISEINEGLHFPLYLIQGEISFRKNGTLFTLYLTPEEISSKILENDKTAISTFSSTKILTTLRQMF